MKIITTKRGTTVVCGTTVEEEQFKEVSRRFERLLEVYPSRIIQHEWDRFKRQIAYIHWAKERRRYEDCH